MPQSYRRWVLYTKTTIKALLKNILLAIYDEIKVIQINIEDSNRKTGATQTEKKQTSKYNTNRDGESPRTVSLFGDQMFHTLPHNTLV